MKILALVLLYSCTLLPSAFAQTTNATLTGLANNTVMDLGLFQCTQLGGVSCDNWGQYSRFTYDNVGHRMLGWGGGHSTTSTDTVFALDLGSSSKLQWTELYAPTPIANQTAGNWDSVQGSWKAGPSGPYPRPTSTHSVSAMPFDPVNNSLVMMAVRNVSGDGPVPSSYVAGKYAHYSVASNSWSFSTQGSLFATGEQEATPCDYDPLAKVVLCVAANATIWTYDPVTKLKTMRIDGGVNTTLVKNESGTPLGNDLNYNTVMVYNPHDQNHYYFKNVGATIVYRITLDRKNYSNSTITQLTTTGTAPSASTVGWAYDSVNGVFGTFVSNQFRFFNWRTKVWAAQTVTGGSPGSAKQAAMTVDFDPVNGVFIFTTDNNHTWAYKYITNAASADFATRCTRKGVIRCEGFDDAASITGTQYVNPTGIIASSDGIPDGAPASTVLLDTSLKSSGAAAARWNVPHGSPPCSPTVGCWGNNDIFYNFANDYSVRFGENSSFYLFFRAYFGPGFMGGVDSGNGGFKLLILNEGNTAAGIGNSYNSCNDLSIVYQTFQYKGFLQSYNYCQGASPGMTHDEIISGDQKLQNARPTPFCLYSRTGGGYNNNFTPNGNCWKYDEQAWMSFKMKVTMGARSGNFWLNSRIQIWGAHDGQAWEPITDWVFGPSGTPKAFDAANPNGDLYAGIAAEDRRYGQAWLGLRNASQWPTAVYMLYDELIVSTDDIAAPGVPGGTGPAPPTLQPVSFKIQ